MHCLHTRFFSHLYKIIWLITVADMQEQSVELAFHLLLIFNARYIVSAREHFNYSCMINDAPDGIVNSEKDNCPFTIKNKLYLPYILHFQ